MPGTSIGPPNLLKPPTRSPAIGAPSAFNRYVQQPIASAADALMQQPGMQALSKLRQTMNGGVPEDGSMRAEMPFGPAKQAMAGLRAAVSGGAKHSMQAEMERILAGEATGPAVEVVAPEAQRTILNASGAPGGGGASYEGLTRAANQKAKQQTFVSLRNGVETPLEATHAWDKVPGAFEDIAIKHGDGTFDVIKRGPRPSYK